MEFSTIDIMIRVGLVLISSLLLTIGTVFFIKLVKINIKDIQQRTGSKFMSIALVANLLFIYTVYLLMRIMDHKDFLTLGFSFSKTDITFTLFVSGITFFVSILFITCLSHLRMYEVHWSPRTFIKKNEGVTFLLSFIVLFIAALQEEVMYRGYLAFIFQGTSFIKAMLLSTLIFTVWHFIGNRVTIFQVIDWFVGGLLLFYVYSLSESIWVVAVVHFTRNLANVVLWNIANKHSLYDWNQSVSPKYKTIYILTLSTITALLSNTFY